jgi:hypothetical protein
VGHDITSPVVGVDLASAEVLIRAWRRERSILASRASIPPWRRSSHVVNMDVNGMTDMCRSLASARVIAV